MDDNFYWPKISPNDLLPTDLPGRLHLIQHFNENPTRSPPPAFELWEEKNDRGKTYRDLRDGQFDERRKNIYLESWGVDRKLIQMPISFLDITKQALDMEGVFVLAEALRDQVLSQLQELHIGQSRVWDLLSKDNINEPKDPTHCCQKLASAIVMHQKLNLVRLIGIDLPISILRGDDHTTELELAHRGLSAIHGLIIAAGLKNNQILTNVDIRLNSESLGPVGLNALSHSFSNGGVMKLETLNGIVVDKKKKLIIHRSEEYELVWIARRIRASCNHRMLEELVLVDVGLDHELGCIVGEMILGMSRNIKLVDLSNNQTLCGVRCDRYGIWRGDPSTKGLDSILSALNASPQVHIEKLALNGCVLGSEGVKHLANNLKLGKLRVRELELRDCSLLYEDLAVLFTCLANTRIPDADKFSVRSVTAMNSVEDMLPQSALSPMSNTQGLSSWSRTDLGSSFIDEDSYCCTVECLDTRGNPVKRSSEAQLALLIEDIYEVGVLLCLNGIDFRPYRHLLYGPTSDQDGLEWWKAHRHALGNANENVKLLVANGRVLNVQGVEGARTSMGGLSVGSVASKSISYEDVASKGGVEQGGKRPITTRGGFLDNEMGVHHYDLPILDLGSGWFAEGSDSTLGSVNTSDWRKESDPEQGERKKGLGVHELCFASKMSLRMRVTHLSVKGTRLCGLTSKGEGALGISEEEKQVDLEPLRSVVSVVLESSYLLSLDIGYNALGSADGAVQLLSEALAQTVSLRSLNLKNNRITPFQLEHITGALELNVSLETLVLSENFLGGYNAIRTEASTANMSLLTGKRSSIGVKGLGKQSATLSRNHFNNTNMQGTSINNSHDSNGRKSRRQLLPNTSVLTPNSKSTRSHHRAKFTSSQESYQSMGSYSSSLTKGTKPAEPLLSTSRAVSSIISRFMNSVVKVNKRLTSLDLRDNGWTDDEKELFADALDIPRVPPFKELRLS